MDYNIYIHSNVSGEQTSPTQPWNQTAPNPTKPWKVSAESGGGDEKINPSAFTPSSLIGQGVNALKKAVPAVAVAFAIVTMANKVMNTMSQIDDYYANKTGDYRQSEAMRDFLDTIHCITHPFSTANAMVQSRMQIQRQNAIVSAHRELLGDVVLNTITNRGV